MEGRCAETTNLSLAPARLGRGGSASDISFDDFRASWVIYWVPRGSTSTSVPEQLLKDGGNSESELCTQTRVWESAVKHGG